MTDLFGRDVDAVTAALVEDPDLYVPVSADFARASDTGYGQLLPPEDDDAHGEEGDLNTRNDRSGRALSDAEELDLDELGRVMSGGGQPLMAASGRGAYVEPGDEDSDVGAGTDPILAPGTDLPTAASTVGKWRQRFAKLDWGNRRHRWGVSVAAAVVVVMVASAVMTGGDDPSKDADATQAPAFSVPTVTQSAPSTPPAPTNGGTDGPVGIKSAQSRCTAGSTDPKQAFDGDPNSAWMCVPAYQAPGTVLRVEFDNWYVVTGVTIVPGWNRVNPDGSDEWIKHMTAETVEYQFNDPDETRFTQSTNNLRDEVVTPIQPPVLASAMTVTITAFGKPTGAVADTTTVPGQGGVIASDKPATGDLKDFAISSISVIGHRAS